MAEHNTFNTHRAPDAEEGPEAAATAAGATAREGGLGRASYGLPWPAASTSGRAGAPRGLAAHSLPNSNIQEMLIFTKILIQERCHT